MNVRIASLLLFLLPSIGFGGFDPAAMHEKYTFGAWYHGIGWTAHQARNVDGLPGDEILIANGAIWRVQRWDPQALTFVDVGVYENGVAELWGGGGMLSVAFAVLQPGTQAEVAVLMENGRVRLFGIDGTPHKEWILPSSAAIDRMTVQDVDGDGADEIVLYTETEVSASRFGASTPLWRVPLPHDGGAFVAQLDEDPQMEIALTSGDVIDSTSLKVQWHWALGFLPTMTSGDLNGDGSPDLLSCSSVWGRQCDAFDVAHGKVMWEIFLPSTSYMGPVVAGDVDFDGRAEIFEGDSQHGSMRKLDGLTGRVLGEFTKIGGTNFVMLANLTGACETSLIWARYGNSTSLDQLLITETGGMKTWWSSIPEDRGSSGLVFGDFSGNGHRTLLWGTASSSALRSVDVATRTETLFQASNASNATDWYGRYMPVLAAAQFDSDSSLEYVTPFEKSPVDKGIAVYDGATRAMQWSLSVVGSDTVTSLAAADLTGDGVPEILVGSSILYLPRDHTEAIYAVDGATKKVLWRTKEEFSDFVWDTCPGCIVQVAAVDLDGDGSKEVVGIVPSDGLFCFEGRTGARRWVRPELKGWGFAVADVDPSPGLEIIVPIDLAGRVAVYNSSGETLLREKKMPDLALRPTGVQVADIDGDGAKEILVATDRGGLVILAASTLDILWSGGVLRGYNYGSQMVIGDLDGDGTTEIAVPSAHSLRIFEYAPARVDVVPPMFNSGSAATTSMTGCCAISVKWPAAGDTASMPVTYRVYRSTNPDFSRVQNLRVGETAMTCFTDVPLAGAQTYYYAITAVDAAGNETADALQASATSSAACGAPKRRAVGRRK